MEKKKLTIGEFNDSFMPVMDGVGNVVKNYTIEMRNLGHSAYAIVPGYAENPRFDIENGIDYTIRGKEFYPIKKMKPYGLTVFPREVKKELFRIPFDIVHTHCPTFSAQMALKIAKKRNIPIISTFHTFFKDDLLSYVSLPIADEIIKKGMKFYEKCDEVWTPSEGSKKKIQTEYFYNGPIRVVENGCDMKIPSAQEYEEMKEEGLRFAEGKKETPILIYVGQQKNEKNIPLILEALNALNSRGIDFLMLFVGEGKDKSSFEKYVLENNLSQKVKFLGKITDRQEIACLYCASSMFLFPSIYDTSCLVMREAAAFSLPTLFVDIACTSEGIKDGEDGFIIKNDALDFANRLEHLLQNPNEMKHAGEGARKNIYRSWKDVSQNVENLYYEIIAKKNR